MIRRAKAVRDPLFEGELLVLHVRVLLQSCGHLRLPITEAEWRRRAGQLDTYIRYDGAEDG
jgi:hypothetical protein